MSESNVPRYKPYLFSRLPQNRNSIFIKCIVVISLQHKTLSDGALPKYILASSAISVVVCNTSYLGSKCPAHDHAHNLLFVMFILRNGASSSELMGGAQRRTEIRAERMLGSQKIHRP